IATLDLARYPHPDEASAVHSLSAVPRLWQTGALRMRVCRHLAGLGLPPTEHYLLPLCGPATVWQDCCHSRKDYRGAARFWSELAIEPVDLAAQLWRGLGRATAGWGAGVAPWQGASRQGRNPGGG